MGDHEKLRTELVNVARSPTPPNEAATCDWIILPVLRSLGYERHEILPQATEGRVGRPDYTILPETDHTWFVEAKAWNVALESTQADQALNYAHANGRRWVLLTNGREWRLYDDTVRGRSEDRLVGTASLEENDKCFELLSSLTRSSVLGSHVERYVASTLVRKALDKDLKDPSSSVIKAIHQALKKAMPVEPTIRDVVSYFEPHDQRSVRRDKGAEIQTTGKAQPPMIVSESHVLAGGVYEVTLRGRGVAEARGTWDGSELVVKAGSKGRRDPVPSYAQTFAQKHLANSEANCRIEGNYRVVERDLTFTSPSGAAGFLNARSTNGWDEWRLPDGRPLDAVRNVR